MVTLNAMNDCRSLRAITTTASLGILSALALGCSEPATTVLIIPLQLHATVLGQERVATDVLASSPGPMPVKRVAPAAKGPEGPPASAPQPQLEAPPPVPPALAVEPALDIAALKARLRETKAIGVMTKLTLKNQVDDLMEQFRTYHSGGQTAGVATLRPPYDMLLLKVLAVLQEGDPELARTIGTSREAIWAVLADREKFNALS